jgi:hypothetical protein
MGKPRQVLFVKFFEQCPVALVLCTYTKTTAYRALFFPRNSFMSPAGKTHTMRGDAGEPGIIPQAVQSIFNTIEQVCRTGAHRLHRNIGIPPGMRDRNLVKHMPMFNAVSFVVL